MIAYQLIKTQLAEVVQAEERLNYKKDQIIFYQGHQPYGLYVIRKGRVLLRRHEGHEEVLSESMLGPGDYLGLQAFLRDEIYRETAIATDDVELSFFSKSAFRLNQGKI